ncbi:AraC family transcriptional regulator [Brenneria sp. g21c3]|uniref:helix-turn-helix domain-containing protein n=1 Tax=Brenneria sp. g21c3 TaxID=3093893 RepID=UPI002EB551ED|nr:AraC family transcriptional regulator [Brenneria sp. g21c3]
MLLKKEYQLSHEHFLLRNDEKSGATRFQPVENYGKCYSDHFELAPDLTLVHLHYSPICDLVIKASDNPHKNHVLVITFGLHGKSCYQATQSVPTVNFTAGYTTINAFHHCTGQRRYKSGETTSQLRLVIGGNLLRQYIGKERADLLLGNGKLSQLSYHKTPLTSLSHASILTRHINHDSVSENKLILHTHSLCLLSEQLERLLPQTKESRKKFSPDEIQKLEQAQNIMQQRMGESITEEYLCATLGMSKCKLREGFRYLFNSTPYKMLLEMRMRKAYLLLESGYQVAQTAWSVGYSHPNNFSVAFNKFFGYPPKLVFHKQ